VDKALDAEGSCQESPLRVSKHLSSQGSGPNTPEHQVTTPRSPPDSNQLMRG